MLISPISTFENPVHWQLTVQGASEVVSSRKLLILKRQKEKKTGMRIIEGTKPARITDGYKETDLQDLLPYLIFTQDFRTR